MLTDMRRGVVIDTSVQVERLLLQIESQRQMEKVIARVLPLTTETTYRELFAGLAKAFLFVVSTLLDRRGLDALTALAEVQKGVTIMQASDRERAKVQLVIALLLPSCGASMLAGDLASFAEDELHRMQEHGFFVFGTSFEDRRDSRAYGGYLTPLECSVARRLVDEGRSIPSCNQARRTCRVRKVLGSARHEIGGCAETLSEEKSRHRDALLRLAGMDDAYWEDGETKAIGQRLCWPIGDTLITLECPEGRVVLTSDRDFVGITHLMGRGCVVVNRGSTPAGVQAEVEAYFSR